MDHGPAVDTAPARRSRPLADRDLAVVFHDPTTVHIHGEGTVEAELRAWRMNNETGGIARQFVPGAVQVLDGPPSKSLLEPVTRCGSLRVLMSDRACRPAALTCGIHT